MSYGPTQGQLAFLACVVAAVGYIALRGVEIIVRWMALHIAWK